MDSTIHKLIKEHVCLLREHAEDSTFRSIYDFEVYNEIFIEDVKTFSKAVSKGSRVLDFGCGRGTSTYLLSHLGYSVEGIDVRYDDLGDQLTSYVFPEDKQRALWDETVAATPEGSVQFTFYDGSTLPYEDNSFDAVFAYAVIEHVEDVDLTLSELARVLKPEGQLFIARTPSRFSLMEAVARWTGMPAHDILFSRKEIVSLLHRHGFSIRSLSLVDFFPSSIPSRPLNKVYQQFHGVWFFLERVLRFTPVLYIFHHFRIISVQKGKS